jgi:DNA-dependent protein kinase catalytic subunit
MAFTHSAVNQTDFRIFVNLVDLYVDIITASELSLFVNTIHKFLYVIIKLSYKNPLIPGFLKLVRIGMKILVYISEEEEKEEKEEQNHISKEFQRTEELLSNYLIHVLDLIPTFSNELLIACLHLILDARFAYIGNALPRTLPAFKIAFTIGLSNLELAYTALVTLETWTQKREQTDDLLHEIVPYLEPYLRSTESSIEILQDLTKVAAMRKRVKHVDVIDTECTLRNFQRRVLLFLGSLDYDLLANFVHERASRNTGASWDCKNLIKYTLSLPDMQADLYFDRMLPRVIALARESSDRRTKIAACEVLHSMITIVIGLTASHASDPENRFITFYGILCPTLLVLGCDSDEVVCGLFRPLTLQLMHWSSKIMQIRNMRDMGEHVINSLFNGLTDDSNPALREFSGICLAELTDWLTRY